MAYFYQSQIIEIPGMGLSDCVLITGVPKDPHDSWIFGSTGIDDPGTTKVRISISGNWQGASNDGIACTAGNYGIGTSIANIYMFPRIDIDIPDRITGFNNSAGTCSVSNKGKITRSVNKVPAENWVVNQTAYWDKNNPDTLTNVNTGAGIAGVLYATPTSGSVGYIQNALAFNDGGMYIDIPPKTTVPKRPGLAIGVSSVLFVDVSGNHFNGAFGTDQNGTYAGYFAAEAQPISATSVLVATIPNNKFSSTYQNYMHAAMNVEPCFMVPIFGSSNTQLENRHYYSSTFVNVSGAPLSTEYTYQYRLRRYKFIRAVNKSSTDSNLYSDAIVQPYNWSANIAIDPPTITWTEIGGNPPGPGPGDPGPRDLTGYQFVFCNITMTQFQDHVWKIFKKTPNATIMSKTYVNGDVPYQRVQNDGQNTALIQQWDNHSRYVSLNETTDNTIYVTDLTKDWKVGILQFDSASQILQMYCQLWKIVGENATSIDGPTLMTKTVMYNGAGSYRLCFMNRFDHTYNLAALGETDPSMKLSNYYMTYGNASPPNAYSCQFGTLETNVNNNALGYDTYYENRYELPYWQDKAPYTFKTNFGSVITTNSNEGYFLNLKNPGSISYTGSVTVETSASVYPNVTYFRLVSNETPTNADPDLIHAYVDKIKSLIRVKRKVDGYYIHRWVSAPSIAKGLTWSTFGTTTQLGTLPGSTFGSGSIYGTLEVAWRSPWFVVDRQPGTTSQDIEIEFTYVNSWICANKQVRDYTTRVFYYPLTI